MRKQKDAELVLKLFELRRDPELRKARHWYIGTFNPKNGQDIADLMFAGPKASAYYRMVTSYWDMAAALVINDGIDQGMFLDTSGEMIMVFAKLQPHLEETRQILGRAGYLKNLETVALRFPDAQEAFESRRRLAAIWLKAAAAESAGEA
jgi:hypothetical protein